MDDHRPYSAQCPWCVAGGMKAKQAFRVPRNERMNKNGHAMSVDLSGPFEPDVDDNTFGLVGIELESS